MAEERAIHIAYLVNNELNKLSSTAPSERCLFKVPSHLCNVNRKAYEPEMIAIGPYHHDKEHLQAMTEHKQRYLDQLLRRLNENSAARYIQVLINLEERARQCYAEPITLDSDTFVKMLLLDGCFVIELIRKITDNNLRSEDDPIFKYALMLTSVQRDLLLLENQLPFFILQKLFDDTRICSHESNFIHMILKSFGYDVFISLASLRVPHLLGLIHGNLIPSSQEREAHMRHTQDTGWCSTLCPLPWLRHKRGNEENGATHDQISCATELQEAGIKFGKAKNSSWFEVKFENETLLISKLRIEDTTESFLRNLIAYEQFFKQTDPPIHVSEYINFMDFLINTKKDVELLRRCGIIENWLGDDEVVANLFNRLLDNVCVESSYYRHIHEKANKHCSRRRNVWKAKLKHDYFNSPWALVSFLAAVLLLILSTVQTTYSVLSYYK